MLFLGRKGGDAADPQQWRPAGPDSGAGPGRRRPGSGLTVVAGGALRASPGRVWSRKEKGMRSERARVRLTCLSPASLEGVFSVQGRGFGPGAALAPAGSTRVGGEMPAPRVGERELLQSHVFTLHNV